MILPQHFAKLAARGQATVALVPITKPRNVTRSGKTGWKVPAPGKGTTYTTSPWAPRPGSHEPLRSHDGARISTVADIIICAHHTILLGNLLHDTPETLGLIRQTGCKTRTELAREWMRHADRREWPPREEALCERCGGRNEVIVEWTNPITHATHVETVECPHCDPVGTIQVETLPTGHEILQRFRARHGNREVHLVDFHLDTVEHRRLLSPAGRPRGDDLGYTENPSDAMHGIGDAGEAIPVAYQTAESRKASERDDQARRDRGEGRDLARERRNRERYEKRRAA